MKLNEILKIAKETERTPMRHGESCLIAIQDGAGYVISNKEVVAQTGYDHIVKCAIYGNKSYYTIIE